MVNNNNNVGLASSIKDKVQPDRTSYLANKITNPNNTVVVDDIKGLGEYLYNGSKGWENEQRKRAYAKLAAEDLPLVDSSADVILPVAGKLASVGESAVTKLKSPFIMASSEFPTDSGRRAFIESIPGLAAASVAAVKSASHIAPSVGSKAVSKYVTDVSADAVHKANQAAYTHRYGIMPDMDNILKAKNAYTKETYGIPTVEVSKYRKLIDEDIALGRLSPEVGAAKIANVVDTVKANRNNISKDPRLSSFNDAIEEVRRAAVSKGVKTENTMSDVKDLFTIDAI